MRAPGFLASMQNALGCQFMQIPIPSMEGITKTTRQAFNGLTDMSTVALEFRKEMADIPESSSSRAEEKDLDVSAWAATLHPLTQEKTMCVTFDQGNSAPLFWIDGYPAMCFCWHFRRISACCWMVPGTYDPNED